MIVGEVLSETALPRHARRRGAGRAPTAWCFPISIAGIVAGSLIAGPLVSLLGLTGAMVAAGASVLAIGALLLSRPLEVAPVAIAPVPSAI